MRFAIIGAGFIGPINTAALAQCEDVQIVAIANRTVSKAQAICDKLGLDCPVFGDWREMLQQVRPEAVVIYLCNDLHCECFLACAAAGIHVLVEKPLANTYEECLQMMEAEKRSGIRASVLQTQRYNGVYQTAKAYIDENSEKLGKLISVNDHLSCHYFWEGRNPWHLDPVRSGGGIVMNYGVHQLDRVHFFLGQKTVRFHACYQTEKPGISTVSSYTMMGVGDGGAAYAAVCNGYSGPAINETILTFQNGIVRCVLGSSCGMDMGVYAGDTATSFQKVPLLCENGDGGHTMYVREMAAAVAYLSGKTQENPVSLAWGAEMVRLCCSGFEQNGNT